MAFSVQRPGWGSLALLLGVTALGLEAQIAQPPETYYMTQVNSMMGRDMTTKIARDGLRVVVISTVAPAAGDTAPQASHTVVYYDLQNHKNYTWNLEDTTGSCTRGDFTGDWGDPFLMSARLVQELAPQHPHETGSEKLNGIDAKVMETDGPEVTRYWVDPTFGLLVKVQTGDRTVFEVKQISSRKPAASIFALPAQCTATPPSESERIAAETGGKPGDYVNALMIGGSRAECSVALRVVRAGTMEPIVSGFQIAIDTQMNADHMATYSAAAGPDGHAAFSGGTLREVTDRLHDGVLRIDGAPAQFEVVASFGRAGSASGLIYRNCSGPESVLLLVVKDPAKPGEGADWLWAKSGKFASAK